MIILRDDIVKVRKEHRCFGCLDIIHIGEQAKYLVEKDGGDFLTSYWCKWCNEYRGILPVIYFEDGICEGDMWEIDGYVALRMVQTGINSLPKKFRKNENI